MRDIRFRAWDKVSKTMYTDAINNCVDSFDLVLKHPQIYEVMEFTGLKDKNGVEIYEGDIVTVFDAGEVFTGIVAYDLEECDFKATNGEEDYGNNFSYIGSVIEEIEVIGNIYENPELLKEGE